MKLKDLPRALQVTIIIIGIIMEEGDDMENRNGTTGRKCFSLSSYVNSLKRINLNFQNIKKIKKNK